MPDIYLRMVGPNEPIGWGPPLKESKIMKLNLGCGNNIYPKEKGWVNVDIDLHEGVDTLWDLECFPWPWEDNSVHEIFMSHILEHLGQTTEIYLRVIKELYRVSQHNTLMRIFVPHPRHNHFIGDPTHVRAITPDGFELLSKKNCAEWKKIKAANTPLADYLDVDFEVVKTTVRLDPYWDAKLKNKEINETELEFCIRTYNNVVRQYDIELRVIKE